MVVDPKYTKAVSSTLTVQTEENTLQDLFGGNLGFTLCDRTVVSDNKGSYFVSFNLPASASDFTTASTLSNFYPELQQLNVDEIVIVPIPAAYYSEFIDGRTITMNVPQKGGTFPVLSSITLYSSTYTSDKILKSETNPLLGDNIVFLFSDSINRPYTGLTINEIGITTSNSGKTSWNPDSSSYLKRPSAVQYLEVKRYLDVHNVATDLRTGKYSVPVGNSYPDNRPGYNYDVPCGFAVLDKGYIILTHSAITSNIPWTSGLTQNHAPYVDDSQVSGKTGIYFTGVTASASEAAQVIFEDINTSFKTTTVALALPAEFYISNNPTANRDEIISALDSNGIVSFPPVYISECGLVNALGEIIAIAKLSEPYKKTYTNIFNLTLDIEF